MGEMQIMSEKCGHPKKRLSETNAPPQGPPPVMACLAIRPASDFLRHHLTPRIGLVHEDKQQRTDGVRPFVATLHAIGEPQCAVGSDCQLAGRDVGGAVGLGQCHEDGEAAGEVDGRGLTVGAHHRCHTEKAVEVGLIVHLG